MRNECYNYFPTQTHFRVRPQVWVVTQRLMNFQWHFTAVSLQSCCPSDVFESNPCSKMNVISQVLCTTDFDTFKKLSTQSKVSSVYYHLPNRREISKRKFASPRGHGTSLSHFCEILDCSSIPFTCYMLLGKTLIAFCSVFQKKIEQRKRIMRLTNQTVSVWYWLVEIDWYWRCPYRQNFYFLIWFYISPNELLRKKYLISIKCNLFRSFKKRSNLPPFWSTIRSSLPFFLNGLWRRLRNKWPQAWIILLVLPL